MAAPALFFGSSGTQTFCSRASLPRRPMPCVKASAVPDKQAQLKAAARFVVEKYLLPWHIVGLGTGVAVNSVIEEIAERIDSGSLKGVRCVAASNTTASEAAFHGVPLANSDDLEGQIDVYLEVADELDGTDAALAFVAGQASKPQQPQLLRARQLAARAAKVVVLVDSPSKVVDRLGGDLPVVVEEELWEEAGEELDDVFVGDAEISRRSPDEGAGPRGGDHPYVSPEGHNILDIHFYEGFKLLGEEAEYESIAREIEGVEGVVAHGLYAGVTTVAVVAGPEGPQELFTGVLMDMGTEEQAS